jgi:lipopolysaccharide export system protein LptA
VKHILLVSVAICAAASFGQSENLRLDTPLLGKTEAGLGDTLNQRKSLGYEDTPLAPKKNEEPAKKPKGQTEITALEATFDQKTREAVFIQDVVVKDPEFTVNCDRLTAYLKKVKTGSERPPANPPPANPSPAAAPPVEDSKGGLERAVAEANPGSVVLIRQDKIETDGSISQNIGKGRKATYDATTGNIVLTGMPSVQQGVNLCIATDESTIMTLNRNGRMKVTGPFRTVIKETSSEGTR